MKKTIATISISMMIILIVIVICGCHPQSYAPIPTYLDQDLGAIAAGPDGNVWFTEPYANEIGKISPINYAITAYQVPPAYASTYGIALGSDGNLWFMEQSGNKIGKISPSGNATVYSIPGNSNTHNFSACITAGPDNNLWFTESDGNKIGKISPANNKVKNYVVPVANAGVNSITTGHTG
jgi:virginiamycin B lyase